MIHYRNISCDKLTEEEINACANLFSENYGTWSDAHENPQKRGKNIVLSPQAFQRLFINKSDRYVALVYNDNEIIGQAFYLKRKLYKFRKLKNQYITLVLQLVLKKEWRGNKIGTKLLHSIWGLSNNYAWGIFTSNPRTISALENATLRKIDPKLIRKRLDKIRTVVEDVFDSMYWINSMHDCCVDTNFPVDHSKIDKRIKEEYTQHKKEFPFKKRIGAKEEWLAFVFHSQKLTSLDDRQLQILTETSHDVLQEAYSKMNMNNQSWASHTVHEIDYLIDKGFIKTGDTILDLGCGNGRHVIELHRRGFSVHGVDFSCQIDNKWKNQCEMKLFDVADILNYKISDKYDVVLCLYDVIGSYSDPQKNKQIVNKISECLKHGGIAVISVMNMHLTQSICKKHVPNIKENIDALAKLPPSQTMQKTGNIFDGKLLLIDDSSSVVYHKEQFIAEDNLPVEFIVPDRRYTLNELNKIFVHDFEKINISFVQAGHWDIPCKPQSKKAKEILAIFRKKSSFIQSIARIIRGN